MGSGFVVFDGTSGNGCTAPWIAAYQPIAAGKIEIRIDCWPVAGNDPSFGGVRGGGAETRLMRAYKTGLTVVGDHTDDTVTSYTQSRGNIADGGARIQIRALLDHGAANVLQFFQKDPDTYPDLASDSNWTQIGTDHTPNGSGSWNTANGSAGMDVAYYSPSGGLTLEGNLYRFMYIVDGTVEFDADFTDLTSGEVAAKAFTEDSSNAATVTINGSDWTYDYGTPINRTHIIFVAED